MSGFQAAGRGLLIEIVQLGLASVRTQTTPFRRIEKMRCQQDRKSTRLNPSHLGISYAVFCLKKKNSHPREFTQRLVHAHTQLDKLSAHVHLPVQATTDRLLATTKRGHTSVE